MKKLFLFITIIGFFSFQVTAQNQDLISQTENLLKIYQEESKPYIIEMAKGRMNPENGDKSTEDLILKTKISIIESSQSIIKQEVFSQISDDVSIDLINSKIENQYKRFYPSLDFAYYEKVQKRVDSIIVKQ